MGDDLSKWVSEIITSPSGLNSNKNRLKGSDSKQVRTALEL
jgi:hypothetical protein